MHTADIATLGVIVTARDITRAAPRPPTTGHVPGPRHRASFTSSPRARSPQPPRRRQNHIAESSRNRSLSMVEPNKLMAWRADNPTEPGRSNPDDIKTDFMNSRGYWIVGVIALTTGALAQTSEVDAAENAAARLTYEAYYGGISAVEIEAKISVSGGAYELSTSGKSIGFLEYLFPFQSHAHGTGPLETRSGAREFAITSSYRGKSRRIKGSTKPEAAPVWTVEPPIPLDERDPVPDDLRMDSLDPMAAVVAAATRASPQDACGGTARVYNGKVRTDVHLNHLGSEVLSANRFSSYSGPAEKCEARYETLAGAYKKSWFGSDTPPPVIQFWIAQVDGSRFWIPVRVEASTEIAKVLVHLTNATIGNKGLIGSR
jgi:hypothetical protein